MSHRFPSLQRRRAELDQLVVDRLFEAVVLRYRLEHAHAVPWGGRRQHVREVEPFGLPAGAFAAHLQPIRAADQLGQAADPERGHDLAHLVGHVKHEADHVFGLPVELRAQDRVLRRDADRAGVQVAFAHHDAAARDQRCRREPELLGAEQRGDHDIAPGAHSVRPLVGSRGCEIVLHQYLVRLAKPSSQDAGVFDGGER